MEDGKNSFGFLPEREWGRDQCHPGRSNIRRAKGFCHSVSSTCTRRWKRLQCPIEPQCPSRFSVLCTMGKTRTNMRWKKNKNPIWWLKMENIKWVWCHFFSLPAVMELGWADSTWCRFFGQNNWSGQSLFWSNFIAYYVWQNQGNYWENNALNKFI